MSFDSGRLSHAYIIESSFADTIAMAVVCSERNGKRPCGHCVHCDKAVRKIHPDITVVGRADDKLIVSVDQIRDLKKDVYIVPNDSLQKAYIVNDADAMNASAQNAFLQILEEPPEHAVFILCTDNPAALLPTVRSRCLELKQGVERFDENHGADASDMEDSSSHDDTETGLEEFIDDFISSLEGDNVKLMECMFRLDRFDRLAFSEFLALARERVALSLRDCSGDITKETQKALVHAESILVKAREMLDLNVSAGHISGFICASLVDVGRE